MAREVSSQQEKLKDYLVFQIHRNIVNLYKNHLILFRRYQYRAPANGKEARKTCSSRGFKRR